MENPYPGEIMVPIRMPLAYKVNKPFPCHIQQENVMLRKMSQGQISAKFKQYI